MSQAYGIKAIRPNDTQTDKPHIFGFASTRTGTDDLLLDAWNGPSSSARAWGVTKDGWTRGGNGAPGTPTFSFLSDSDTGLYRIGADNVGLSAGGSLVVDVSGSRVVTSQPVRPPGASASAPAYAFDGDADTGLYRIGADNLGFAAGGSKAADLDGSGLAWGGGARIASSGDVKQVADALLFAGANITTVGFTTQYNFGNLSDTTATNIRTPIPYAGTLKNLRFETQNPPGSGSGGAFTVAIWKGGTGTTTLAASTASDTATTGSDTSSTVSVAAGDTIAFAISDNASSTNAPGFIRATCEFEAD